MPEGKGDEMLDVFGRLASQTQDIDELNRLALMSHAKLLEIHSRALACHSECLGMNAENSWAVCNDNAPPYTNKHYRDVMKKWGMVDEEGEPII